MLYCLSQKTHNTTCLLHQPYMFKVTKQSIASNKQVVLYNYSFNWKRYKMKIKSCCGNKYSIPPIDILYLIALRTLTFTSSYVFQTRTLAFTSSYVFQTRTLAFTSSYVFQTVIPLNEECGLLEWVNNTSGLRHILIKIYKERGIYMGGNELKAVMPPLSASKE